MHNGRVSDLLRASKRPLLSFEFFPPKDEAGLALLTTTAEKLLEAKPDFVTVTCGALGSARGHTLEICGRLQKIGYPVVVPHMTCVGSTRADLESIADEMHASGCRNVMALRGDPPKGEAVFVPPANGLAHASELVALLKARHPDFCCGVAAYPEKHPEAKTLHEDILHLKEKVDAGADFVNTQLFFENRFYYNFVLQCRAAGILQPVLPGLMPALSAKQIQRFITTCNVTFPAPLAKALEAAGDNTERSSAAGIEWLAHQIDDLLKNGAPGVHLYVLNRTKAALAPAVRDCFARYRS